MEVVDFCRLMKDHFNLLSDRVPDAPKYLRIVGPPYDPTDLTCKSVDVPTKGIGFTQIAGPVIKRVLDKFDLTEEGFKEAYNAPLGGLSIVPKV
jgi:hypothetical protein